MRGRKKLQSVAFGALFACLGVTNLTSAEEVPAGYVVTKANLAAADKQTFQGHNLGAMITPVMRKMVGEHGLTLKLANSKPMEYSPSVLAATEKYSKDVKYDKATRRVSGYVAGIPFPNLSESDPDLADKVIWNHFYNYAQLTDMIIASTRTYSIDGVRGIERSFDLVNAQLKLTHRNSIEPVAPKVLGDGKVYRKLLIFNLAPQDIAGTGAYIQRYDDGRVDDSWAYVKSIRRIRRISGGAWMDPIPGTDIVNDDSGCHDAFPVWYPQYKYVGKQWILAVVNGVAAGWPGYKLEDLVDTKNPPYWNPINQPWEPREVYVIDMMTPDAHPYSRKRVYYDIQGKAMLWCDMYDKKGQLWKIFQLPLAKTAMADGQTGYGSNYVWAVDFQRLHSTYIDLLYHRQNDIRVDPNDWAPETLADSEKFSIPSLTKRFGGTTFDVPWAKAANAKK